MLYIIFYFLKFTLVRFLLLQGKPSRVVKSRPAVPKAVMKKHKAHMVSIPLDRKENLAQPGCSKSSLLLNKCFKAKTRKDITLKTKNTATDKMKTKKVANLVPNPKTKLDLSAKIPHAREKFSKDSDNLHLREIRFIKNSEVKTVIAKYDNADFDESLVVSWDSSTSKSQVYTQKSRVCSAPPYGPSKLSEPSTSKRGAFRIHNFAKATTISKTKMKKHTLRRLSSATDTIAKVDKKKKKLKVK